LFSILYALCVGNYVAFNGSALTELGLQFLSLWCGLAPSVAQLIVARAVQGVGAALLIPCSLALFGAAFDEAERGKAIGTWSGFAALAGAGAPILGGFIVDHVSWRFIFFVNPVIALRHVADTRDPRAPSRLGSARCWRSPGLQHWSPV
jgi:MFS family permease